MQLRNVWVRKPLKCYNLLIQGYSFLVDHVLLNHFDSDFSLSVKRVKHAGEGSLADLLRNGVLVYFTSCKRLQGLCHTDRRTLWLPLMPVGAFTLVVIPS